jgi:hypothetical protein
MLPKLSGVSVAVFGVLLAGGASAVEMGPASGVLFEPKTIDAGGFEVMPWLGLAVGNNSNVGLSNGAKTSSNFTILNPNLVIGLPTRGQFYGARYSGKIARFSGSKIDNYNDHEFGLVAENIWSERLNSQLNADYLKGHDGRNALLFRNKEIWHANGVKGMVHYGAEGAQGQFELAAGQMYKRYDSNNGGATQLYNYDRTDLTGTFFYKVAPATQMFVEANNSRFTYVDPVSKNTLGLDSTEQRYMVGVKWNATAKTTGSVKMGSLKKSFSLGLKPSATSTVWDAEVNWSPKTYSVVDVSMHQRANEYGGVGSFIISRDTDLRWTHDWSGYVTSALSFGEGADTFQASNRTDKRQTYALKASYGFRTWLRASIEYRNTKRNSTVPVNSYTQDVTMLMLEGSL